MSDTSMFSLTDLYCITRVGAQECCGFVGAGCGCAVSDEQCTISLVDFQLIDLIFGSKGR